MNVRALGLIDRLAILMVAGLLTVLPCSRAWGDDPFPDPAPEVKTYEWSLSPAKEPFPALKYKLLTDLADTIPGNAAVYYNRAIVIKLDSPKLTTEQYEQINQWYEMPLEKLPINDVKKYVDQKYSVLAELKTATLCETCDWGVRFQDLRGMSVIETLLPEFQQTRDLARILRLKARVEIAEKRFNDALETIRQSYQLARHVATAPAVIPGLVGVAILATANESLGEFISAEGSPNMYWALRAMPDPVVDLHTAMRFESTTAFRLFPFLKDADTAQRPPEEWGRLLTDVIVTLDENNPRPGEERFESRLQMTALALRSYSTAKRELIAAGYDRVRIEKMPVGQVVAIFARDSHQQMMDESLKWNLIPFPEGSKRAAAVNNQLVRDGYLPGNPNTIATRDPLLINARLGSVANNVNEAQNRQPRLIALLTAVEAIRLHAAANGGQFPKSLADITVVPVPVNPASSKPFLYRVVDGRAELLAPPIRQGDEYSGRRVLLKLR